MRGKANLSPLPTALYSEKTDNLILCRLRHASAQVNAISLGRQVLHRIGLGGFLFGLVFFHFIKKNCPWAKPKQREKEIFTFGLHFDVIHTQKDSVQKHKDAGEGSPAGLLSIQGNGSARTSTPCCYLDLYHLKRCTNPSSLEPLWKTQDPGSCTCARSCLHSCSPASCPLFCPSSCHPEALFPHLLPPDTCTGLNQYLLVHQLKHTGSHYFRNTVRLAQKTCAASTQD